MTDAREKDAETIDGVLAMARHGRNDPAATLDAVVSSLAALRTETSKPLGKWSDNVPVSQVGRALRAAYKESAGDDIDYGLALIAALKAEGFTVHPVGHNTEGFDPYRDEVHDILACATDGTWTPTAHEIIDRLERVAGPPTGVAQPAPGGEPETEERRTGFADRRDADRRAGWRRGEDSQREDAAPEVSDKADRRQHVRRTSDPYFGVVSRTPSESTGDVEAHIRVLMNAAYQLEVVDSWLRSRTPESVEGSE